MHNTKSLVHIILALLVLVLCVSCGVSGGGGGGASPSSNHSPAADDPTQNYFSIDNTEAASNYSNYGSGYKGICIYYKIYTNASNIITHYNTINAESTGAGGVSKLEGFTYRKLNGTDYIIPSSSTNQNVVIRLFNETSYTSGIEVDGNSIATPKRYFSNKTFQFSSTEYPETGDGDFNGTQTTTGPWFVAAYAVSVSQSETSLIPDVFSKPKYLGYIKIYY